VNSGAITVWQACPQNVVSMKETPRYAAKPKIMTFTRVAVATNSIPLRTNNADQTDEVLTQVVNQPGPIPDDIF